MCQLENALRNLRKMGQNFSKLVDRCEEKIKENCAQLGKRTLSDNEEEHTSKKMRLSSEEKDVKMKTLITFGKFMESRKFGSKKLTRSDLEQFCLQKICEAIIYNTDVGELHQKVKKQEVIIDNLKKEILQLVKQNRDLEIVHKKLMNELKLQNGTKKPLVPLKITRSVGLQVKLNVGLDPSRRKQPVSSAPATPSPAPAAANPIVHPRVATPANPCVVRQLNMTSTPTTPVTTPSPRKTQSASTILSKALQTRQTPTVTKRPPIRPKPAEPPKKTPNPGVIDLTDEDDKTAKAAGNLIKHRPAVIAQPKTVPSVVYNRNNSNKTLNSKVISGQGNKNNAVNTAAGVSSKTGAQTRTIGTLQQGVRLTSAQLKNGLTIPANVVTSNASGTTQLMYVVQPTSSSTTSTAGGAQKAVLLNFQPTSNGMLASTLNGQAVSVIPSMTVISTPRKHPAALPVPPVTAVNPSLKPVLPKPHLSIRKTDTGIILQWRMPYNLDMYENIASYQLFAYPETNAPPSTDMWRKVGDVKALALPMACTFTQFADTNKYYFAVRSVDVYKRIGAFSDPEEISL